MKQITYQKRNGELIQRTIGGGYSPYRVGDVNSYGWKIVDIKFRYNNKWLSSKEYDFVLNRDWKRAKRINKFRHTFYSVYKELAYCVALMILIKFLEATSKVFA